MNKQPKNTKHTPGPWTAYPPDGDCDYWEIEDPFGRTATVYGEDEEAEANARLMAASPELLVALEALLRVAEAGIVRRNETGKPTWSITDHIKTVTRAAINKATGNEV